MKINLRLITLAGLVATALTGFAQANPPAGDAPATNTTVTATNDAAQLDPAATATPAADASPAATEDAAAPPAATEDADASPAATEDAAASPAATEDAAASPAATQDAAASPAATEDAAASPAATEDAAASPAATEDAAASPAATQAAQETLAGDSPAPSAGPTNSADAASPGTVIPLIVMDDVPLTDAIKNLARQAGLNYMLDPKVAFGQPGPNGKVVAQPMVSVRWENVTAGQALNALLGNYNLQLVEDPKSKIARVTIKDPAAPDPLVTKVIQLQFASPSNVVAAVEKTFTDKRSKVIPDVRTSQLVVLATEKEMVDVDKLVARLDTQTKQVLIEARLLETQINPHTTKGIDWSGTLANQHVTFGNNGYTRASGGAGPDTPIESHAAPVPAALGPLPGTPNLLMNLAAGSIFNPSYAFLNADGVSAVLRFLNTYAQTKVISSPRTVTLDNQPAVIEVGTMFPIVNVSPGTVQVSGGSQISYSNLTVRLEVTPRISANDYVNLKVNPKILRLGDQVKSTVAGQDNSVYSFFTREIQTSVLIPSGDTLVMGGLIEDNVHQENTKVPVLGDIPILGYLFRSDLKDRQKSNLIVFLTPTIVQDEDFQPTETDFLKTPVPTKDSIEPPWSSWDSGKPRDWSRPEANSSDEYSKLPTDMRN